MISRKSFALIVFTAYFMGLTFFTLGIFGTVDLPGITVLGVTLFLVPALVSAFDLRRSLSEVPVLISMIIPLALANFLYSVRTGLPVGFQDVHSHIIEAETLLTGRGVIDFGKAQTVSFSFVGLYVIAWFGSAIANSNVVGVASWLPPAIDVLLALMVYLVARRIFNRRAAALALIFFAWDNNTILFGHEFRTQTIGTLFMLGAILVYLSRQEGPRSRVGLAIAGILFLFALSTTSFVSGIFALVMFTVLAVVPTLARGARWIQGGTQYGLFIAFFALYVLYVSTTTYGSPSAVVASIVILVRDAFSTPSAPVVQVGQQIYGPAVQIFAYGFWLTFGLISMLILRWRMIRLDSLSLPILTGLAGTFAVGVGVSAFSILSPGRAYAIGSILIGLVVGAGLVTISNRIGAGSRKKFVAACCVLVIMFVAISVAKFPVYVVGNPGPIRGHELIDDVPTWRLGAADAEAADFLLAHGKGARLHLDMPVAPYMLLGLYERGFAPAPPTYDSSGRLLPAQIKVGDLILLRNSYAGKDYAFRSLLPPESAYDDFSLIYTDGDYNLYAVGA